jgi:hypothetical protein
MKAPSQEQDAMLGSHRDLVLLFAGLAIGGCLTAFGIVLATSELLYPDHRLISAGASAAGPPPVRQPVGRSY